jgi:hypothetical protein
MSDELRFKRAQIVAQEARSLALNFFNNLANLNIEDKWPQNFLF